jgi:hypothetical protein
MSPETLTTAPAGRVKLGNLHVLIDGKPHEIINMNIVDVLIAGAPDWIAARQKIDFSFVITLDDHPRPLPTYGVVVRNDDKGLEIRYNAPALRWRDILAHLIAEDARHPAKPAPKVAGNKR